MKRSRSPCVYTTLIGDYESLNEQPMATVSDVAFVCLTDNPDLRSETWKIVQVSPVFALDPIRSQRLLKICPHQVEALADFDTSLYIDNSVILKAPPEEIFDRMSWDSGIGLMQHSFRDSVHDEFIEVARLGFDDQSRIFEQLNHYLLSDEAILSEKPFWDGILLRDHASSHVQRLMDIWSAHVLRYSRRDQLSLNISLRQAGLQPDIWAMDNMESWFHCWPHSPDRARFAGTRLPMSSLMPSKTRLHDLETRCKQQQSLLEAVRHQCTAAQAELESHRTACAEWAAKSEQANALNAELEDRLRHLQSDKLRLQQTLADTIDAFHSSTSWRISAPLRKLRLWLT